MSGMTKARFNPRRKVIQFTSWFRPGNTAIPTAGAHAGFLSTGHFDDGFGEGLRRLLRQVMSDAPGDQAVGVFAGKLSGVDFGIRMRRAVGVAFEGDGRNGDDGKFGQPLFQFVVFRLARGQTKPPAIIVDHDGDMVGVVEGRRAALESGVIEIPLRRGEPPDQF